jgi:phosphoglycolate phosphatase/putative hydrolase of the HAD superfamily
MEFYSLPQAIRGIVFDIDRTLYTNEEYVESQVDTLVSRFAGEKGVSVSEAERRIHEYRDAYKKEHGTGQSLGNTFAALGVPMSQSVAWREEGIEPERYLEPDRHLQETLLRITSGKDGPVPLVALTNNPVLTGRRALRVLGVEDFFIDVVGLDTTMQSKPDTGGFSAAFDCLGCDVSTIVSVGDRYIIDVEPALKLGAGGILVGGVLEVYGLPDALTGRLAGQTRGGRGSAG